MVTSPNGLAWECPDCLGTLSIEGESLNRLAFCVDPSPLWGGPPVRGENVIVPGAPGRYATTFRVDETTFSLPLLVNGHWDRFGSAVPASRPDWGPCYEQLEETMAWLIDTLTPVVGGDGPLATAVLSLPSGGTRSAEVQVLRIPPPVPLPGAVLRTTLDIRDPSGALHL